MTHRLVAAAALAAAVLAAACGAPSPSASAPSASAASSPPESGWPPIVVAKTSPPPGVTFVVDALVARVSNGSDAPLWLSPPTVEVWQGSPWVEGSTPGGSKQLDPGASFEVVLSASEVIRRAGVRLWPTSDTRDRPDNSPWFLWKELSPSP